MPATGRSIIQPFSEPMFGFRAEIYPASPPALVVAADPDPAVLKLDIRHQTPADTDCPRPALVAKSYDKLGEGITADLQVAPDL